MVTARIVEVVATVKKPEERPGESADPPPVPKKRPSDGDLSRTLKKRRSDPGKKEGFNPGPAKS